VRITDTTVLGWTHDPRLSDQSRHRGPGRSRRGRWGDLAPAIICLLRRVTPALLAPHKFVSVERHVFVAHGTAFAAPLRPRIWEKRTFNPSPLVLLHHPCPLPSSSPQPMLCTFPKSLRYPKTRFSLTLMVYRCKMLTDARGIC
jgi:hypothetical protein